MNKISWKFITPLAPWQGGFYERLVGIVKNCLKRTLDKHLLTDSQLTTIVKEIEAVVNTRPLTSVDSEMDHILSPADFLTIGKCITPDFNVEESKILQGTNTRVELITGWKRGMKIIEEFKDMFVNRYLHSLRERYNNSVKQPRIKSNLTPEEGQLVQIKEDNKNRHLWKVGRIITLIKGQDGQHRTAKVKVGDKEFIRSIGHLYPLEVEDNLEENPINTTPRTTTPRMPDIIRKEINTPIETEEGEFLTQPDDVIPDMDMHCLPDISLEELEPENRENLGNSDLLEQDAMDCSSTREDPTSRYSGDIRPKRNAAIKALDKIRSWTNNLVAVLNSSPAGVSRRVAMN